MSLVSLPGIDIPDDALPVIVAKGLPRAGDETYEAFPGEIEHPEPGEVIFADAQNRVHARRWTNRQSGSSSVRDETLSVLIVSEALHETAKDDMRRLLTALWQGIGSTWGEAGDGRILTAQEPGA